MKASWFEIALIILTSIVGTLVGIWAWDEFKAWRVNRTYGPDRRRGPPGRRRGDR